MAVPAPSVKARVGVALIVTGNDIVIAAFPVLEPDDFIEVTIRLAAL